MTGPTDDEIHAVRKVLYAPARLKTIAEAMLNMSKVMNLDANKLLPPTDVRYPAGSGPQWYYPDTGGLDINITQGAKHAREVAAGILAIRSAISHVAFPQTDKQNLMTALQEEAAVWTTRATLWTDPQPPSDPVSAAAGVQSHLTACARARAKCHPAYFKAQS
jgi:hypothetical protein